jgi:hypothetical protein
MKFFEVSAKNSNGIDYMFYNCIIQLPFFEQFDEDKKKLINELEKNNKNNNNSNNNSNNINNINKPVLNVNVNVNKSEQENNIDNEDYKDFVDENGEKCNC